MYIGVQYWTPFFLQNTNNQTNDSTAHTLFNIEYYYKLNIHV